MKVFVIGSGGREHALCEAFSRSSRVRQIFCANGNAGIASIAEIVDIKPDDIGSLGDFAEGEAVEITFVGGETALALGIVDEFERRGLRIVGASAAATRLEASKSFAKDFMSRHGIPTARYVNANSATEAKAILESGEFADEAAPVVVKADGLAAGKGVVVAGSRDEAIEAIRELPGLVGVDASATIVLEECLTGKEVSLIAFCDGDNFALMPPTRDHKRIGEGDTGPNTGGMGTFSDDGLLSDEQLQRIRKTIVEPTLQGCRVEGFPFRGILFLGLMMDGNEINVLEYNVRFGDPETQSILVRLETDIVEICEAMLEGRLSGLDIKWKAGSSACVVLAAEGYPGAPRTGDAIAGLAEANRGEDVWMFHAGTAVKDGEVVTAGGRVLGVTAVGSNLDKALSRAYDAAAGISWPGMQFRRDIGQ